MRNKNNDDDDRAYHMCLRKESRAWYNRYLLRKSCCISRTSRERGNLDIILCTLQSITSLAVKSMVVCIRTSTKY